MADNRPSTSGSPDSAEASSSTPTSAYPPRNGTISPSSAAAALIVANTPSASHSSPADPAPSIASSTTMTEGAHHGNTVYGNSNSSDSSDSNNSLANRQSIPQHHSVISLPNVGASSSSAGLSSLGASSGFALPIGNPFKDSSEPANPFSPIATPADSPVPTPLGSPTTELRKLSLGVERYARAIQDPGPMGSFSGMVPLPSLSQTDHIAAKRRPSKISFPEELAMLTGSSSSGTRRGSVPTDCMAGGAISDAQRYSHHRSSPALPLDHAMESGAEVMSGRSTGISLNSIKRALSGKRRQNQSPQDVGLIDLESNLGPQNKHGFGSGIEGDDGGQSSHSAAKSIRKDVDIMPATMNDLENPFTSTSIVSNADAQSALMDSLSFAPQPLLLPVISPVNPQHVAMNESRPSETAAAAEALRRRLEESASKDGKSLDNNPKHHHPPQHAVPSHDLEATATQSEGVRRRKPKGGILSQLLKLQHSEAVAAAAASGNRQSETTPASGSSTVASRRPGQGSVKKTRRGFYYRSSSKNNSQADLASPSVTTTPKVSPRSSTIFEVDPMTVCTRIPTNPPVSINNVSSPFTRHDTSSTLTSAIHAHGQMEEMEALSSAATASAASTAAAAAAKLGIQHDIAEILTRQSFLIMMAKALILYGAPSHRIEETCALLARKMDVDASFALLPGLMTISFSDPETHTSDTRHLRCTQGMDMYKLSKVYTIALAVMRGGGIEEANKELEKVTLEAGFYPVWVTVLSWMTCAAFVAPLAFNGSWVDTALAGLCGLVVGLLGVVAAKFPVYGNVFEVTSSIVVGFIAKAFGDRVCFSAVALAGVVVLLPGLLLTQAIMELASRNIVSGSVRMFYALMYAFFLGFGLNLGAEIWDAIAGDSVASPDACKHGVDPWWYFFIFPAVSTSINIVFNAHPRQWPGMTIVTAVGFTVSYFMTSGPQVTPAVAAFAVGVAGQAYGRLTGKLSYVPLLSGVLLLVPGSVGVRSVLAIFDSDTGQGFQFALRMVNIAVSITLGVFCSALVWYPFWRKSTFMNF